MLRKFFRGKREPATAAPAAMPPGVRAYAIGDVHGRHDLLEQLIATIDADSDTRGPADVHLILLGDLIDRGPESARVVDLACDLTARDNVTILKGNHEEVFLLALEGNAEALRFMMRIGGIETALSYGMTMAEYRAYDLAELADRLRTLVPQRHIDLLDSLTDSLRLGDYMFVHAGVRPGVAMDAQRGEDLRWIRDDFLNNDGDHGGIVVHGHTPTDRVDWRHNRIGIDTGAWDSGCLTALGLEGTDRWTLDIAIQPADSARAEA